ncbi:MAG: DNA-binding Lrp family transcriptional regulator [Rhodothermales bacterium]|jgi:DNA-binding Lrp family transcriptional regulator
MANSNGSEHNSEMSTERSLDRTDHAILDGLVKNARLSNKELAAAVGIAPSTCLERVRRLNDEGVVTGYHAEVNPAAVGVGLQALIAIKLGRHSRPVVDAFQAHALGLPEVTQVFHTSGANDFLVHVAVRDAGQLRDLVLTAFTERPEVVHIETAVLFGHYRTAGLPRPRPV